MLTTPVREGAVEDWSRFQGASAAIGHYIRLVHEGRLDPSEGREAICGYNAAMLRPSWPVDRLQVEAERLWALHVKRNGPPLLRAARSDAPPSPLPTFSLGALLDDRSPMTDDIIAPRVLTPGGLAGAGRCAQGRQERFSDLLARAYGVLRWRSANTQAGSVFAWINARTFGVAVVFHQDQPPEKETHHGCDDSDPQIRQSKD